MSASKEAMKAGESTTPREENGFFWCPLRMTTCAKEACAWYVVVKSDGDCDGDCAVTLLAKATYKGLAP